MRGHEPNAEFLEWEGIENLLSADTPNLELAITMDQLLNRLADTKPDWCMVVEAKYFLGLTDDEAAEALGLKLRTLQPWRDARQWLFEQTEGGHADKSPR